jgi:hypothetical protein
MINDELIPVYVPRERLPEVYALLATRSPAGSQPPSGPLMVGPEGSGVWPNDLLRRLVRESPPGMRVIFEALAMNAGEWLTADDLAEALKKRLPEHGGPSKPHADWNTVAGTLGAFGRRFKNHYSSQFPHWPFETRNDYQSDRWRYRMQADVARETLAELRETGGKG